MTSVCSSVAVGRAMKLALVQLKVSPDKALNVKRAAEKIHEACTVGKADLVCLPECFNSPYGTQFFPQYAESIPGHTSQVMSDCAKQNGCYLVAGSIPERDEDGKLFNSSCVFSPTGHLLAKFRKMHLFDIDIPGKIRFKESEVLSAGNEPLAFEVKGAGKFQTVKVGLGICYDMRFPCLASIYRQMGCHLILYPGAFNMTTGPLHWQLLQRCRATDNQLYVGACAPARDETGGGYVSWANTSVVDPWAKVVVEAGVEETIVYSDIDPAEVESVRSSIPILKQSRDDVYRESVLVSRSGSAD